MQLLDARELWMKMRKSLGEKRKQVSEEQIGEITRVYGALEESERVKVFPNEAFGYQRITVEQYYAAKLYERLRRDDDQLGLAPAPAPA